MEDKLIIKNIKKKRQKGMEMLIDKYSPLIKYVIKYHLKSLNNYIDDCINDTLLAIWENIDGFCEEKNSFKNWICAIAKYKAIDYKRKYLGRVNTSILDENSPYIDKNLLKIEIYDEINQILSHLSKEDKEIFKRYYINDESIISIANDNKLKVSTIHSKLSRGRAKIRKYLLKYGGK